jgi:hypothetical protein
MGAVRGAVRAAARPGDLDVLDDLARPDVLAEVFLCLAGDMDLRGSGRRPASRPGRPGARARVKKKRRRGEKYEKKRATIQVTIL